jgi:glycosyltransferase involved in cell wall biosynthesis
LFAFRSLGAVDFQHLSPSITMKFHILLPVRDEGDIIAQCLDHLLQWADTIYVFDTGSVDETWEIVQSIAAGDRRVVCLGQDAVFFSETRLRSWIFHRARQDMRDGDWFLRVDADEFHHVPPPDFVKTLERHETIVYQQYYDFRLRESDVANWEAGLDSIADRERPIEERHRWFIPSVYSEPRLCRYRETMRWPATVSFPYNAGFVARRRLPIRHYPHRDPEQLRRRCRLRAVMMADAENRSNWTRPELHHWAEGEWRKFVVADELPGLCYWAPGTDLPEFHHRNHLKSPPVRAVQRLLHAVALPLADRVRPQRGDTDYPQKMPAELSARLEQTLRG